MPEPQTLTEWVEGQILDAHNKHAPEILKRTPPELRDEVQDYIIAIEIEMANIYSAATGIQAWEHAMK